MLSVANSKAAETANFKTVSTTLSKNIKMCSACRKGHFCRFETLAFHVRLSGICRAFNQYRHPDWSVPNTDEAGRPHAHFVSVFNGNSANTGLGGDVQGDTIGDQPDDKQNISKVLGMVEEKRGFCLLDDREYYSHLEDEHLNSRSQYWQALPRGFSQRGPQSYIHTAQLQTPLWKGDMTLEAGLEVEYKYIEVGLDGGVEWEKGGNHDFQVPQTCDTTDVRQGSWK